MPRVAIQQLGQAIAESGWAEPATEAGFAENWDRELFGIDVPPWRWSIVRLVEAAFHAFGGRRIVVGDMGCGAATYARHLMTTGISFSYHGYDHNAGVLRKAQRRLELLPGADIELHQLDARDERWPLSDEWFDVLIWDSTLRFCENPETALGESFRTTRGWVLLARTPLEEKTWREDVCYYGMKTPSANWHFSADRLREFGRAAGWRLHPSMGDVETHVLSQGDLPASITIRATNNPARTFHIAYVRERVRRIFDSRPGAWAVYGGGAHSRWLMSALDPDLASRVAFFLDDSADRSNSNPGAIAGRPILHPCTACPSHVVGVLVSSDTMEDRLHAAAKRWIGESGILERLYPGLPAGPYDKGSIGVAI